MVLRTTTSHENRLLRARLRMRLAEPRPQGAVRVFSLESEKCGANVGRTMPRYVTGNITGTHTS